VHMPSAQGRAELRAGAGVVAIGVGSPVARLGADGRRRREARAAVSARAVGAELATQVSRTKWFGWSWGRALWLVAAHVRSTCASAPLHRRPRDVGSVDHVSIGPE